MKKKGDLAATLGRLDALLADKGFAKGATPAAIAKLSKKVFAGKAVPSDVATLFRWHDGQTKIASLHPDNNRTMLSIERAIAARAFLSDGSNSWLPLFENGAGDYVCIETKGKNAGALIGYWHADEDRDVEHASLSAWAADLESALAKEKTKKKPKETRFVIDAKGASWTELGKPPTKAQVAKRPIGTVFWWLHVPPHPRVPLAHVFVKVEDGAALSWRTSRGKTPADALARVQTMLDAPKKPSDDFWKRDDFTIAFYAKEESYDDGADDPVPVVVHEGRVRVTTG